MTEQQIINQIDELQKRLKVTQKETTANKLIAENSCREIKTKITAHAGDGKRIGEPDNGLICYKINGLVVAGNIYGALDDTGFKFYPAWYDNNTESVIALKFPTIEEANKYAIRTLLDSINTNI